MVTLDYTLQTSEERKKFVEELLATKPENE
jgi:hypothetical protein